MISILPANPGDADALSRIAFAAKAHWGYPVRWLELWKPELTFRPEYFVENESWVAGVNGDPVAFYTLQDREGAAWLENLWVLPGYIGRGVGNEMFLHALGLARQRSYKMLQLESDPNAVGFYEKMGMKKIGERQYELDGQPRILPLMEIAL